MRATLIAFCLTFLLFGCKTEIDSEELSGCIEDLVQQAENGKDEYDAWQIIEYEYQDDKYYLVATGCCDRFEPLLDSDCTEICNPAGGITGGGDGKCPDWVAGLTDGVIIWERE